MKILSINGGGVFGAAYARWLKRISDAYPLLIPDTNFFTGTSVGGIIALGLASGQTPTQIDTLFGNASAWFTREVWRLFDDGVAYAKWDNTGRETVLNQILGNTMLGDLPKLLMVMVPAFNQKGKPVWSMDHIHNIPNLPAYPSFSAMPAATAGVITSAAPTYFPSYGGYVDGGIAENDPSATALAMAYATGIPFSDIQLLSIGCEFLGDTTGGDTDTGVLNSLPRLIKQWLTGNQGVAQKQCYSYLDTNYFSFRPMLPEELGETKIDDEDAVPAIQKWADSVDIGPVVSWLTR